MYGSHNVFELVLSGVQGLSDALRQKDFMSKSLLPKRHSAARNDHHLPALILQHGHLETETRRASKMAAPQSYQESANSVTCSTMEASRPSDRPHSSPRVTTALPSFTTIRLACFNSLRWANDFPWVRGKTARVHGRNVKNKGTHPGRSWHQLQSAAVRQH